MTAEVVTNRRFALGLAAAAYAGVLAAFIELEHGGLGIAHFFYVPVCLVALATDAAWGAFAGVLATGLYAIGIVLAPGVPVTHAFGWWVAIRLATFTLAGMLVGWYAHSNRGLLAQLHELATHDFLTGVGNARVFDERLAQRCDAARPFTLVLADIDELKLINDAHGHAAGNISLRVVADALRANIGPSDDVARIGGDEFAILFDRPPEEAALVCARIVRALLSDGLHLSFGTTSYPADGTAAVELFRKADDRLFAAKLVSRNRRTVVSLARS